MALLIMGPGALVFGVYCLIASVFPNSALERWLGLHVIAVTLGVFLLMLSVVTIAYLRDDGMVE